MIVNGNALHLPLADNSVQCCITSPPYWGLRDYGTDGQLGLEPTPEAYVANLVAVFREVRRVLRNDGVVFLNLGDSYNSPGANNNGRNSSGLNSNIAADVPMKDTRTRGVASLKPKDLCGIPWRVAFALQADGWWLRSDIIWAKPNPMPESVTDRPTRSHEYLFLLTKSSRYFYDAQAIAEPSATCDPRRPYGSKGMWEIDGRPEEQQHGGESRIPASWHGGDFQGDRNLTIHPTTSRKARWPGIGPQHATERDRGEEYADMVSHDTRNKRDVWTITTKPFKGAHFATMPPDLVEPCIKAGSREGDVVLDPFAGAGTVGLVASRLGRRHIGVELSPEYCRMAERRVYQDAPLLAEVYA